MELHFIKGKDNKSVLQLVVLNGKIGDRITWIQKVMESLWEVDTEERILCIDGTKFRINLIE